MDNIYTYLDFTPNYQQKIALGKLKSFINSEKDIFILNGSAGTGKTSIIKALTTHLDNIKINISITAPTGRAASIISGKTGQRAKTIHSLIYTPETLKGGLGVKMIKKSNTLSIKPTIYIVDEASMVSNKLSQNNDFMVDEPLLKEFISFVKQGNKSNKIVFVGDKYQLPPVFQKSSPALDIQYLKTQFGLSAIQYELSIIMRQNEGSVILDAATNLRELMKKGISTTAVSIDKERYSTIALNRYMSEFDSNEINKVIAICLSNKDVKYWNKSIRQRLGLNSKILSLNDIVICQKTWMNQKGQIIYNGEYGIIIELNDQIENYANIEFVNAKIKFISSNGEQKIITTKVMLDSLHTNHGTLPQDNELNLFAEVNRRNRAFRLSQNIGDDKYLSSMRLKHGYATTCHKAQGGEWDNVLIHPWNFGRDLNWAYTAITRARKSVYSYAA